MSVSIPPVAGIENLEPEQIKTFKDFLVSYNKLTEMCFNDCIDNFTSRNIKDKEEKCALNCLEKFLKVNQRISERVHEFQVLANENAMAAAQKMKQGS
ncbi:mitochondrial import inner membrane translocase subunit Tim9-like [Agrilus planipennis]|uniref:Mitochondrial import inner membrane translocase subunit n=1 Tax=Agrilus planipennis TaxID=224129 RepID=A0A1W4XM17_AGRPL|nr:mitochondrial import inner membrane translocase subunit Tim9-like [Agrilus planipennis]